MTAAVDFKPVTEAEKAAIIAAGLERFANGLHHADDDHLAYEVNRLEDQQIAHASPVITQMRAQATAEQDARRAVRLLTDLGSTGDAIADRLRALGIKGAQCFAGNCPLATYLATHGIAAFVSCDELSVPVTDNVFVRLAVPAAAAVFIKNFDRGVYLDLVDPELTDPALDRVTP
jgi:hypothetical protein